MCIEEILKMIILMENCVIKEKMDKYMMVNGKIVRNMDMENINGLMVVIIKVNMYKVKNKVKELCIIQVDKFMMDNGMKGTNMEEGK